MKNKFILEKRKATYLSCLLFLFLFSISFISAQPPGTTTIYFESGYTILNNPQYILEQNQPHQVNFFVYNTSNGYLITNNTVNCTFFLADNKGEVVFSGDVDYFTDGHWGIDVSEGNFSRIGEYGYGISCQDGGFGGALSGLFEVTPSGSEQNPNFFYLIYIIIFVFLGLGFYLQDNTFLRLASVMLSLNGLYIILYGFPGIKDSIYTYFVGAILLGLAGYILVKSSYEEIAY
jgi:hypothetical protein